MSSRSSADAAALPSPRSLAIHLDLIGGLAGDMFVAAMIDALPALEPLVQAELAKVRPDGGALPRFTQTTSDGLARAPDRARPARARRARSHAGTAYSTLRARIADAPLAAVRAITRSRSSNGSAGRSARARHADRRRAFPRARRLGFDARRRRCRMHRGRARRRTLERVARCRSAAVRFARNTACCQCRLPRPRGSRPVIAWRDDGVAGERVTPTGAAILRHLVAPSHCGGLRDGGRLVAVGHGAGTRALDGVPNIVRAWIVRACGGRVPTR